MKKIILLLLLGGFMFGAGAYLFNVYELDKTTTPWTYTFANVDSVMIIRLDDDNLTVAETLYTDADGRAASTSAFRADNYERARFSKSGYTFSDNGSLRFYTMNFDSLTDTIAVSVQMIAAPSDSTVTISFTLVNPNGTANSSQRVSHYAASPHRGTNNSILANSASGSAFTLTSYTSSSAGLVEITTLKNSLNYLKIGDNVLTEVFEADSNMTLNNVVFSPKD